MSNRVLDAALPLDALLIDAARGTGRRFLPSGSTARWVAGLARQPTLTATRLGSLGQEAVNVTLGRSSLAPHPKDRRFADPAWTTNPFLRRLAQYYLATGATAKELLDDVTLTTRDRQRLEFLVDNAIAALSPTNVPLINPASAKEAIDTGGLNLVRGARQLVQDLSAAPRIPEMVDRSKFTVGENIAATPGAVIYRHEMFELIQYKSQAPQVYEIPLLVVPPTINKFYAIDMSPGRSLVEFSVKQGRQMFLISWRNPDARHAHWDMEAYIQAILDAMDVLKDITRNQQVVLGGICSGGILASITAGHLAAKGEQDRLSALCIAVTVIDNASAGTVSALIDQRTAAAAKLVSKKRGYLDGKALAEVFAWLRPDDLIWNYWVNNYLLGKRPPAFDILFWNADTTRMTAGLHADFVDLGLENKLVEPDKLSVLGTPIDLSKVTVDSYIVAGIADHITPWQNCYQTTQLLGGESRFVLSTSGHVAALVNPPGNPKASYRTNDSTPEDPAAWLAQATIHEGTWWADIAPWLNERCGAKKTSPRRLGNKKYPPLADAPGTYVFDK